MWSREKPKPCRADQGSAEKQDRQNSWFMNQVSCKRVLLFLVLLHTSCLKMKVLPSQSPTSHVDKHDRNAPFMPRWCTLKTRHFCIQTHERLRSVPKQTNLDISLVALFLRVLLISACSAGGEHGGGQSSLSWNKIKGWYFFTAFILLY